MQQKLKVGILGAGHIAQKMATTLMGMKEAELYSRQRTIQSGTVRR